MNEEMCMGYAFTGGWTTGDLITFIKWCQEQNETEENPSE